MARNWRRFVLWVALIVVSVATVIIVRSVQRHRDFAETSLWMDQTYNPHDAGDNFGKGHGSIALSSDSGKITIKTSFVRLGGCKIAIKELRAEFPVLSYTLSLCDIDPVSINITTFDTHKSVAADPVATDTSCADPELVTLDHLKCDGAAIGFLTTDGAHVITEEEMVFNEEGKPEKRMSKTNKAELLVDDVAYAQGLAKALKRAVELCGGKPSKFWPPHWKSKITE